MNEAKIEIINDINNKNAQKNFRFPRILSISII